MKITPEMIAKIEQCKSPDEIMDLAKKNNFVLVKEQAQKVFELLKSENVSDEMLEKICGGFSTPGPDKYASVR